MKHKQLAERIVNIVMYNINADQSEDERHEIIKDINGIDKETGALMLENPKLDYRKARHLIKVKKIQELLEETYG